MMNLCLIYLTEWVKEFCALSAYPQRWIMGDPLSAEDWDLIQQMSFAAWEAKPRDTTGD